MDYIGLKCEVCGEAFRDGDDVVVCPDCGTPTHRACYKANGGCPNALKHADGFVFDGFDKISSAAKQRAGEAHSDSVKLEKSDREAAGKKGCPICGNQNRQGANFCDNCGTRLSNVFIPDVMNTEEIDYSDPQFFASYALGKTSDVAATAEIEENITAGDVACYVAVNTPYYLGAFKRIKNGSGKFNLSAAVFSGVWFLYRKLYKPGALMLSLQALLYALKLYFTRTVSLDVMNKLLGTIGMTVNNMASLTMEQYVQLSAEMRNMSGYEQFLMMMPTILVIVQIAVMIISGSIANKLYYKRCIEKIRQVKESAAEQSLSRSEISQSLYLSGGVNTMLAGAFGFIYLFLIFM